MLHPRTESLEQELKVLAEKLLSTINLDVTLVWEKGTKPSQEEIYRIEVQTEISSHLILSYII